MLRLGKIRENVLKRSVIKEIKSKREEVIIGAEISEDASIIRLDGEDVAVTTDPVTMHVADAPRFAIINAANDLYSIGAEPVGMLISILFPEGTDESELKAVMRQAEGTCSELNVQIIGGHTEVTKAVNYTVITVTGVGKIKKDSYTKSSVATEGSDIIVSKWIGLEGSCMLARENKEKLCEQFPASFVENACDFDELISLGVDAKVLSSCRVESVHDVSSGGIFAALWEMAESSRKGLDIDLKAIPIRQETVEICEVFGLNPYEIHSGGCMLITAPKGEQVVEAFLDAGINAAVIGKVTEGPDRIIRNDDEIRYLEPPKADEILKVL